MRAMPSRRFLAFAARLPCYGGALAQVTGSRDPVGAPPDGPAGGTHGPRPVPATRAEFARNPELRGLSSFAEVPAALSPEQQAYINAHPELRAPPSRR